MGGTCSSVNANTIMRTATVLIATNVASLAISAVGRCAAIACPSRVEWRGGPVAVPLLASAITKTETNTDTRTYTNPAGRNCSDGVGNGIGVGIGVPGPVRVPALMYIPVLLVGCVVM